MKWQDKIFSLFAIIKVRFLKKRIPLAVRLQVTSRCTLRCKYCNLVNERNNELSTGELFKIIDELAILGTKRISISGGEPLLRNDIDKIIARCLMNRLYPEINSNGNFPLEKIKLLKNIDYLKFSLDGEEEIHDEVRGKGSFKHVMDAVVAAANMGINFGFSCTLTKYNINNLGYLLKIAKKYNTIVGFQPLKLIYRGVRNIDFLAPTEYEHKKAIAGLIKEKLSGNRNIRNTLSGLKLIYTWPKYKKLKCWAGKIFCIIGSNGDLYSCDRISYNIHVSNIIKQGLKESLENLSEVHCRGCGFCGALELNYLMNFNFKTLASIQKIIK